MYGKGDKQTQLGSEGGENRASKAFLMALVFLMRESSCYNQVRNILHPESCMHHKGSPYVMLYRSRAPWLNHVPG